MVLQWYEALSYLQWYEALSYLQWYEALSYCVVVVLQWCCSGGDATIYIIHVSL